MLLWRQTETGILVPATVPRPGSRITWTYAPPPDVRRFACPECGSRDHEDRTSDATCQLCHWRGPLTALVPIDRKGRLSRRPTVASVAELIRRVYAGPEGGAGCCLHVVTDDWNIDSTAFSVRYAMEQGHALCLEAAKGLNMLTRSGRVRAIRRAR